MRADFTLFLPALLAPLIVLVSAALRTAWFLPIAAAAICYPVMVRSILGGRSAAAVASVLLWAVSLSASVIIWASHDPVSAAGAIPHGAAYRDEMFRFIRTGEGREGDPAQFIPQHLLHLAAFALLSLCSAGALGLVLGAVLVGYMSYYVGALAAAGGAPWTAVLLGWPPYAVLRVAAYVLLGVSLARPLLERLARRPLVRPPARAVYGAAAALLAADILLKTLLAAHWGSLLRRCLDQP